MRRPRSLRWRLLSLTLATAGLALLVSGLMLSALFREHVRQQFVDRLSADLDQVMARLESGPQGLPMLDDTRLSDPRWGRPHSGLYWQVDAAGSQSASALLRSRSLWDGQLIAPRDMPANGQLHVHTIAHGRDTTLLLVERTLRVDGARGPWRVMVAADTAPIADATRRFDTVLAWSLLVLLLLLASAAVLQVQLGLAPLSALREALGDLREGRTQRLHGHYPDEVQPLVDDLNGVLARHAEVLQRARAQAGNLAHALKTPLTILEQGAAQASPDASHELAALVSEQTQLARRHIDWHLARARAAAAQTQRGLNTPLQPAAEGLARVMRKVHAPRGVTTRIDLAADLAFAGESQDLHEMLGNLMDNACRAARSQVCVSGARTGDQVSIAVDDDGPGIAEADVAAALKRGIRLDESTPGSGLGLAIVQELAALYGGSLSLARSDLGGLRATLTLPATPTWQHPR